MDKDELERLRQEKKAKKEAKKKLNQTLAQARPQLLPPTPLKRAFYAIPGRGIAKSLNTISVMTYNILAQSLVKRELFPHSGEMLKWKTRRRMIIEDIAQYKPDIMCLQEVDNYDEFYKESLFKLGYETEFHKHATKQHGCMIGYNATKFERDAYTTLDYDNDPLTPPTQSTGNIAQLIGLRFVDQPKGFVVGNTHLYWRPESFYERMRQTAIYTQRMEEFKTHLESSNFNTAPIDATYAAINKDLLTESQLATLNSSRCSFGGDEDDAVDNSSLAETKEIEPNADLIPVSDLVALLAQAPKWQSVYSQYIEVDEKSSDANGEPKFTHYAAVHSGTLDYIFINGDEFKVSELLEIPNEDKVLPALPNRNFGSDHVCLVAKIEFQ
ncbi:hypothetical protein DFQ28_011377 [Apophysomyces sp. BC1034]|nr:hypothetical protein DFQ30_011196 [Apophysomyces sp. BC1015]KAG0169226.1 hypothetical protein DFQ29_009787 [Apophysomyces sp. BC1021]KAG0184325.1 hypothetical protein DFQ28_011377 [Apophysomyces sp. BC1034]